MAKSLQEILGARQMTGVISTVAPGLPNPIPQNFFNTTKRVMGDKSTFIKVTGERRQSQTSPYGAPAKRVNRLPMSEAGVTLLHSFEEQGHNPVVLQALLGLNGGPAQDFAVEEVDRQTQAFNLRLENAKIGSMLSLLRHGKIYIGSDGEILFTSSGAVVTVDYGVPAANLNQIDSIIGTTWATDSVGIIDDITAIKKKAKQATGRALKYAFYGQNILGYILGNLQAKALIHANPVMAQQLYNTGEIPDGFCGLKWIPVYDAFGLDTSDAVTDWWGGDIISFTPEPDGQWLQYHEGSMLVPRSVGTVHADAVAAANDLEVVYGKFAYAVVGHNPPTITQYAGYTWMPLLASPSDLYIADVTP